MGARKLGSGERLARESLLESAGLSSRLYQQVISVPSSPPVDGAWKMADESEEGWPDRGWGGDGARHLRGLGQVGVGWDGFGLGG